MNPETLKFALSKMLGKTITSATHTIEQLQGGTVGNVQLISGIAKTATNETPYKIVLKIQKQWMRDGDPLSWRREYDLYASELGKSFSAPFRWPTCYHAAMNEAQDETQLWMEYVEGITGNSLTIEMLEAAATELGRYQGRLYAQNPDYLHSITNFGALNAVEDFYRHWKRKNVEYKYIRELGCEIPKHLCDMLIDIDNRADVIFENIRKLPVVLCHRDFWIANIIKTDNSVVLIDWDTAGWGYLGEDIIQLITDETDPSLWDKYRRRLIPTYVKSFSEYAGAVEVDEAVMHDLTMVKMGYLCVFYFMNNDSVEGEHSPNIASLQKLHDVFYRRGGHWPSGSNTKHTE